MPADALAHIVTAAARVLGLALVLETVRPMPALPTARIAMIAALTWIILPAQDAAAGSSLLFALPQDATLLQLFAPAVGWSDLVRELGAGALVGGALALSAYALQWSISTLDWVLCGPARDTATRSRGSGAALPLVTGCLWMVMFLDLLPSVAEVLAGPSERIAASGAVVMAVTTWAAVAWSAAVKLLLPFFLVLSAVHAVMVYVVRLFGAVWHAQSARAAAFPAIVLLFASLWPAVSQQVRAMTEVGIRTVAGAQRP